MRAVRQRDTSSEKLLRSALHRLGLRFRVQVAPIQGLRRTADIVFSRERIAIYVDGCFWHGCPTHGTMPKTNRVFWQKKIKENRRRDADTDTRLRSAGWEVIRVWEHAADLAEVAGEIYERVSVRLKTPR